MCFKKDSAKLCGLRGNVGYVGPWVRGCVGAWVRGLRGSTFYVGHNFYVGCVGLIYFCVRHFFT